ncbi:hypothetical protein MTR67_021509 [Solanum verrucosum]|uniref:Uncharacterized protein n=1 Tax=Solanum verrucosum TaxID=315347 RepID=A0AAF0QQ70_SOLVR|nr:hypothetical protein MTR67_021509 [Solanum verrucosum]
MNHKALFLAFFVIILCLFSATSRRLTGYSCNGYESQEESYPPCSSLYFIDPQILEIQSPDSISSPGKVLHKIYYFICLSLLYSLLYAKVKGKKIKLLCMLLHGLIS